MWIIDTHAHTLKNMILIQCDTGSLYLNSGLSHHPHVAPFRTSAFVTEASNHCYDIGHIIRRRWNQTRGRFIPSNGIKIYFLKLVTWISFKRRFKLCLVFLYNLLNRRYVSSSNKICNFGLEYIRLQKINSKYSTCQSLSFSRLNLKQPNKNTKSCMQNKWK